MNEYEKAFPAESCSQDPRVSKGLFVVRGRDSYYSLVSLPSVLFTSEDP